jgi:hypothetical protein
MGTTELLKAGPDAVKRRFEDFETAHGDDRKRALQPEMETRGRRSA